MAALALLAVAATSATAATLSIADGVAFESDGGQARAVLAVTLDAPAPGQVDVDVVPRFDLSDASPADITAATTPLTFAPGETLKLLTLPIFNDLLYEADEVLLLTLTNVQGATLGSGSAVAFIVNDDRQPSLLVAADDVVEGTGGTNTAVFTFALSAPSGLPVTGYAKTAVSSANSSDFVAVEGPFEIEPGETSIDIEVPIVTDNVVERDESFGLELSYVEGAALVGESIKSARILDDEPRPTVTIADSSMREGPSLPFPGAIGMPFTVSLSHPVDYPLQLAWTLKFGSAAPADLSPAFRLIPYTLQIEPGVRTGYVSVPVVGDSVAEADETFTIQLMPKDAEYVLGRATATGTILNDDTPVVARTPPPSEPVPLLDTADMPRSVRLARLCPQRRPGRPGSGAFEGRLAISESATANWGLSLETRTAARSGNPGKKRLLSISKRTAREDPFEVDVEIPISKAACTRIRRALRSALGRRGVLVLKTDVKGTTGQTANATSRITLR